MANQGFSAARNYFGDIAGLVPKSSQDGRTSQVAECPDSYGDTVAHDVYGDVIAPSVEYAVVDAITAQTQFPALGSVHAVETGGQTVKVMVTTIVVTTGAGNPPVVTVSGQQVEADATAKRTYPVVLANGLKPRSKAQDVCGAFAASDAFSGVTTTFSIDPHIATVTGEPVASDASHARVEVAATLVDGTGEATIEAAADSGFTVTALPGESRPDAGYIERTATATKFLNAATEGVADADFGADPE